ncbi:MAG: phosphoenolpyruvate carboxykinase (ATP) [Candidatus Bipolaricaulota bacterium]|nr:MAG: phosphoenolpyruvate carboxykinase (ATP) [Candidatus Bipolaricaulota bacterium]
MAFDALITPLEGGRNARRNPARGTLIEDAVRRREAIASAYGALATWTPPESTGRSPQDTVIVRHDGDGSIDWDSPNAIPITEETFAMLVEDAVSVLSAKEQLYVLDRAVGADPSYALPLRLITPRALHALFADNMFRPRPDDARESRFADRPFILLALPYDRLDGRRYAGRLRVDPATGETSTMAVAMDFENRVGVVYGSAYCGSIKKLMFTVMNHLLPPAGILPLHCSANEGPQGDVALLLGLSGTGKTTLSADPRRALLGDDEHGWSENGIANFENGCYAKLIDLDPKNEPEIHRAIMHCDEVASHGAIVENAMVYPDGRFDLFDDRFTPNSRGSYPLRYLSNVKPSSVGGHPRTILFLTADANGVLPPVSRLDPSRAMLWFLMGYTSKLAGTETGIVEPRTTFSRFFGEPFMPRNPGEYARMLGQRLAEHGTDVYLINTGWTGGPVGIGRRMDIDLTRAIVDAALSGRLAAADYRDDARFHLEVPEEVPGLEVTGLLDPRGTWSDAAEYDRRADALATQFADHFATAYGDKGIEDAVSAACPGR